MTRALSTTIVDPQRREVAAASEHALSGTRAHLLELAGDRESAFEYCMQAAESTASMPERNYLLTRAARLTHPRDGVAIAGQVIEVRSRRSVRASESFATWAATGLMAHAEHMHERQALPSSRCASSRLVTPRHASLRLVTPRYASLRPNCLRASKPWAFTERKIHRHATRSSSGARIWHLA